MTKEEINDVCMYLEHTLHITGQDKDSELVCRTIRLFKSQLKNKYY